MVRKGSYNMSYKPKANNVKKLMNKINAKKLAKAAKQISKSIKKSNKARNKRGKQKQRAKAEKRRLKNLKENNPKAYEKAMLHKELGYTPATAKKFISNYSKDGAPSDSQRAEFKKASQVVNKSVFEAMRYAEGLDETDLFIDGGIDGFEDMPYESKERLRYFADMTITKRKEFMAAVDKRNTSETDHMILQEMRL